MNRLQTAALLFLAIVSSAGAADVDFPKSPINLKEAEAQGLHRLTGAELKALFPGKIDLRQYNGELRTTVTKPDGSLETMFLTTKETRTGKWRVDEQNNLYCTEINSKKNFKADCNAIFQAPDGKHYFNYDIKTGFAGAVWRRAADQ